MLTRLKVTGFKNLVDTEVRFGPLTCIAGLNGVGKSNLFDAIAFVARLADFPFVEAAKGIRAGSSLYDLFSAGGDGRMAFDCDLLIPSVGQDDFHQRAQATQTFLNYALELQLREVDGLPRIELLRESLTAVRRSEAKTRLGFPHADDWRRAVIAVSTRTAPYIHTTEEGPRRIVRVSSDRMQGEGRSRRGGGGPFDVLARGSPRTALSAVTNADEARTAVLVRQEMRRWRCIQLEPSALRQPDSFDAPSEMTAEGAHLPATLHRLSKTASDLPDVFGHLSSRLSNLVEDVRDVRVERDDVRRVLCLMMRQRDGVELPAASLSDGTLRFLAISALELDPTATGVICLEEPENGIHPERIDPMIDLLADIACDPTLQHQADNPLRQVIFSTHSPLVVARVDEDSLVFAETQAIRDASGASRSSLVLRPANRTWRASDGAVAVPLGVMLRYLGSVQPSDDPLATPRRGVLARRGYQLALFPTADS